MVEAVLRDISKSTRELGSSQRQFRQTANENNRTIGKFAKDISSMFDSQRRSSNSLNNAINDSISESQQTASKIDSTNNLLQESVSLLSSMIGELKNIRVNLRSVTDFLIKSVSPGSNTPGGGNNPPGGAGGGAPPASGASALLGGPANIAGAAAGAAVGGAAVATAISEGKGFSQSAEFAARGGLSRDTVSSRDTSIKSVSELVRLAREAGFTNDQVVNMGAIAAAESRGNPSIDTVKSGLDPTMRKEYSVGLWQVNWKAHKDGILKRLGITDPDQLRDPKTNARAAKAIFDAQGYRAWSVYTNGKYLNYLGTAQRSARESQNSSNAPAGSQASQASQGPSAQAITPGGSGSGSSGDAASSSSSAGTGGASTGSSATSGGDASSSANGQQSAAPTSSSSERSGAGQGHAQALERGAHSGIAEKLKEIESAFGTRLNVTSGYRDPQRNQNVGGAGNSAHLRGNAVDIKFDGGVAETLKLIEIASKAGIGGIGVYRPGSVHLDTESKRAWGGDYSRGSVPQWAEGAIRAHETNKWGEYDSSARSGEQATRAGGGGMIGSAMMGMSGGMYQMGMPGALGGMIGGGLGSMIGNALGAIGSSIGGGMTGSRESSKGPFDFKQFSELSESEQTSARFFEADRNLRTQQQRIQETATQEEARKQQARERLSEAPPPPRRPADTPTDQLANLTPSSNVAKDVNERIENWARDLRLAFSGGTGWELL